MSVYHQIIKNELSYKYWIATALELTSCHLSQMEKLILASRGGEFSQFVRAWRSAAVGFSFGRLTVARLVSQSQLAVPSAREIS